MTAINYLKCEHCEGSGSVAEETTGNFEPFAQNYIDLQCDHCNGKGQIIELDEMIARTEHKHGLEFTNVIGFVDAADNLLSGMQKRKEMLLTSLNTLQQMGYISDLYARLQNRTDTINRAIVRIKQYKQILLTYETNL